MLWSGVGAVVTGWRSTTTTFFERTLSQRFRGKGWISMGGARACCWSACWYETCRPDWNSSGLDKPAAATWTQAWFGRNAINFETLVIQTQLHHWIFWLLQSKAPHGHTSCLNTCVLYTIFHAHSRVQIVWFIKQIAQRFLVLSGIFGAVFLSFFWPLHCHWAGWVKTTGTCKSGWPFSPSFAKSFCFAFIGPTGNTLWSQPKMYPIVHWIMACVLHGTLAQMWL